MTPHGRRRKGKIILRWRGISGGFLFSKLGRTSSSVESAILCSLVKGESRGGRGGGREGGEGVVKKTGLRGGEKAKWLEDATTHTRMFFFTSAKATTLQQPYLFSQRASHCQPHDAPDVKGRGRADLTRGLQRSPTHLRETEPAWRDV